MQVEKEKKEERRTSDKEEQRKLNDRKEGRRKGTKKRRVGQRPMRDHETTGLRTKRESRTVFQEAFSLLSYEAGLQL